MSPADGSAGLLDEKVLALHAALAAAEVPHAFGGALALAYYAAPRGTLDVDCNLFVPVEDAARVFDALAPLGIDVEGATERADLRERGQLRLHWEHTPVDLFFAYDPLHESCRARSRAVPFGGTDTIPVLSAEDLALFKALFDRPKDWRDIEEMLFALADEFDARYARDWLRRILDAGDTRLVRFEELLSGPGSGASVR